MELSGTTIPVCVWHGRGREKEQQTWPSARNFRVPLPPPSKVGRWCPTKSHQVPPNLLITCPRVLCRVPRHATRAPEEARTEKFIKRKGEKLTTGWPNWAMLWRYCSMNGKTLCRYFSMSLCMQLIYQWSLCIEQFRGTWQRAKCIKRKKKGRGSTGVQRKRHFLRYFC